MPTPSRRRFLAASALAATAAGCRGFHPFGIGTRRPVIVGGVASGDVTSDAAIIRACTDVGARMHVEWDTSEAFKNPTRVVGPDAVSRTGYTAKLDLRNLPPNTRIAYRVRFENLDDFSVSDYAVGSFRTAPADDRAPARDVTLAWSGDTAGQGWGIDESRGGMRTYKAIADLAPDVFVHSGDSVYADVPIPKEAKLPDGTVWRNVTTPAKSKVAETLDEFRGNHAYNLLDAHVRRFNASVPTLAQWDDHELRNNWWPGQALTDDRYTERDVNVLAGRARQAFLEYMPIRPPRDDAGRIYRSYRHGPLLEVFLLDERSYRGRNTKNRQASLTDDDARFLAPLQLGWLKEALRRSTATWKVIASDMPLSCVAGDAGGTYEAWANGDASGPLGRELELAGLLAFIKRNKVRNTLFVTADVHFPANVHYHPDRATFKEFEPFWEFISGPLHAGGFGPSVLDKTFGPEYRFKRPPNKGGDGPGHGFAAFGVIRIDAKSKATRVTQHDIDGREMAVQEIGPT